MYSEYDHKRERTLAVLGGEASSHFFAKRRACIPTSARMRSTCSRLAETLMLSVLADYGRTCIFTGGMYYRCTTTRPGGWWDSKIEI